jgi:hypothetical protein
MQMATLRRMNETMNSITEQTGSNDLREKIKMTNAEYHRERRKQHVAKGLCLWCSRKAIAPGKLCQLCSDKNRERVQKKYVPKPKPKILQLCLNCKFWNRSFVTPLKRAQCAKKGGQFKQSIETCSQFEQWEKANNTIPGKRKVRTSC